MVNVPAVFKKAVTQILFNTSRKVFYCSCTILQRKTIPQSRQHTFSCYAWSFKSNEWTTSSASAWFSQRMLIFTKFYNSYVMNVCINCYISQWNLLTTKLQSKTSFQSKKPEAKTNQTKLVKVISHFWPLNPLS